MECQQNTQVILCVMSVFTSFTRNISKLNMAILYVTTACIYVYGSIYKLPSFYMYHFVNMQQTYH